MAETEVGKSVNFISNIQKGIAWDTICSMG